MRVLNRSFGLRELALCECALAVAAASVAGGQEWAVPGIAFGAAGLALAAPLRGGRSAYGWLAVAAKFRARRRRGDSACGWAGLDSYTYERRRGADGARGVGMVGDGTFLTAVVRVEASGTGLRPAGCGVELPWELLGEALEVDDVVLASVQVVQQVRGASTAGGAPGVRSTWVALRLEPELCPEAVAARGGGFGGAQRCLVRAADHVASRLTGVRGLRATVLDREGLDAALEAAGLPRAGAQPAGAGPGGESVRAWRAEGLTHVAYEVGGGPRGAAAPPPTDAAALAAALPPEAAATLSLTLRHPGAGGAAGPAAHVRVTGEGEPGFLEAELGWAARAARLDLVRLDREQLPGLLATLPLGGAR
ncbi:type VII secretion protein EccE [Streptomyces spiroverticillatus]|nr:type VII secretion protein EccE [Streptomyces spiroverticillatus]